MRGSTQSGVRQEGECNETGDTRTTKVPYILSNEKTRPRNRRRKRRRKRTRDRRKRRRREEGGDEMCGRNMRTSDTTKVSVYVRQRNLDIDTKALNMRRKTF